MYASAAVTEARHRTILLITTMLCHASEFTGRYLYQRSMRSSEFHRIQDAAVVQTDPSVGPPVNGDGVLRL